MRRTSVWGLSIASLAGIAGCNALLGLDGYFDQGGTGASSSASSGTGGMTNSSSSSSGSAGGADAGGGGTAGAGGMIEHRGLAVWATKLGMPAGSSATVAAIGVDDAGNVYATGSFTGSPTLDSGCTISAPSNTMMGYVLKLDPAGSCVWAMSFGGSGAGGDAGPPPEASGTAIAVSPAGEITVAGKYNVATTGAGLPTLPAPDGVDAFVIRYPSGFDPAKSESWSQRFGDTGDQVITGLALAGDNVHVVGSYTQSLKTMSSGTLALTSTNKAGFAVPLDKLGAPIPGNVYKTFSSASAEVDVSCVAFTSVDGGMVAIGGSAFGGIDHCNGPKPYTDGAEGFFGRYSSAALGCSTGGWLSAPGDQRVHQTAFSGTGHLYVSGSFMGMIDFQNNQTLTGTATPAAFLAHFDGTGLAQKAIGFGIADSMTPGASVRLAVDGMTGDIVFAATLRGKVTVLDKSVSQSAGGDNVVVGRVDSTLATAAWLHVYGDVGAEGADAVAITKTGDVIVAGHFSSKLDLGNSEKILTSTGSDVFIAKLTP